MDELLSRAASIAQVLGIRDFRAACTVVGVLALYNAARSYWAWLSRAKGWSGFALTDGKRATGWAALFVVAVVGFVVFAPARENLVRNGTFQEGTKYWGTGYLESLLTNGNWPAASVRDLPLIKNAGAQAQWDRDPSHSAKGWASFHLHHFSPLGDHVWSSFSQLVTGLKRDTDYVASFQIRAKDLVGDAFFVTLDHQWLKRNRCYARPGTYEWEKTKCKAFNTGDRDFVDFRFVMQERGEVWIDDVALYERGKP